MLLVDIEFCDFHDLDDIYSIEKEAHPNPWPYDVFETDLKYRGDRIFYLGARWRGKLCGFGVCRREGKALKIMNLAVLPEFRRHKVASQLLLALGEVGLELTCRKALLEVRVTNRPAITLYEQFGFKKLRILSRYYEDGEDAYLMASPLPFPGVKAEESVDV